MARSLVAYLVRHWYSRVFENVARAITKSLRVLVQLRGNGWRLWPGHYELSPTSNRKIARRSSPRGPASCGRDRTGDRDAWRGLDDLWRKHGLWTEARERRGLAGRPSPRLPVRPEGSRDANPKAAPILRVVGRAQRQEEIRAYLSHALVQLEVQTAWRADGPAAQKRPGSAGLTRCRYGPEVRGRQGGVSPHRAAVLAESPGRRRWNASGDSMISSRRLKRGHQRRSSKDLGVTRSRSTSTRRSPRSCGRTRSSPERFRGRQVDVGARRPARSHTQVGARPDWIATVRTCASAASACSSRTRCLPRCWGGRTCCQRPWQRPAWRLGDGEGPLPGRRRGPGDGNGVRSARSSRCSRRTGVLVRRYRTATHRDALRNSEPRRHPPGMPQTRRGASRRHDPQATRPKCAHAGAGSPERTVVVQSYD